MHYISVHENAVTTLDAKCLHLYLLLKVALEKNERLPGFDELKRVLGIGHDELKRLFATLRIRGWIILENIDSYENWNTEAFDICITEQCRSIAETVSDDDSFIPFVASLYKLVQSNQGIGFATDRENLVFIADVKAIATKMIETSNPVFHELVHRQNNLTLLT